MEMNDAELADAIRRRGLRHAVATIAVAGGEAVHPDLWYRARSVGEEAWSVIRDSRRADLVPLWTCTGATLFSASGGRFVVWDAESDEPSDTYRTFTDAVRGLLTDLWEDEETLTARFAIARKLLPLPLAAIALIPEIRR